MPHLAIIPAAAVADPNLTDTQIRVLCAIGTHTNRLGGNVWASISTLAKACSLSTRTVQRALPALLERGYLRHLERPGRTTLYEIVLEQGVTMQSGGGDSVVGGGVTTQSPKRLKNDKTNDLRELANLVLREVWTVYPKRETPHLFPPALKAMTEALRNGADPSRLVQAAALYGQEVVKKKTEPRFVRSITRFYADGAWEHYASEVRVHGRTRDEWARSGQDVTEFDLLATGENV
jgi:DNA-binding transcriptional ArsR family regulator